MGLQKGSRSQSAELASLALESPAVLLRVTLGTQPHGPSGKVQGAQASQQDSRSHQGGWRRGQTYLIWHQAGNLPASQ